MAKLSKRNHIRSTQQLTTIMKKILPLFIFLSFFLNAWAQVLDEYTFLRTFTKDEISSSFGIFANYDIDAYKVTYYTPDVHGNSHVASGLICVPQSTGAFFPLLCYQHGTVAGRDDVPSNLEGGYQLALILASYGYVTTAADFLGLGESSGIHPYIHADTEASAAIDLMRATREIAHESDAFNLNDQVFVTGYSQGGQAAMAAHRELETDLSDEFRVTAAAPMSGPYSISEKMVEFTLGDDPYPTVSYLAWVTLGFQEAYPELFEGYTLESIFRPEYLDDIILFRDEVIDRIELNDRMSDTLVKYAGAVIPKFTIHDSILVALTTNPNHPFSMALADNDTYDWAPQAPTRLYYCTEDEQVTFENSILAESVMVANGAADVIAVNRGALTHGGCVFPATTSTILFFSVYQLLSSSDDVTSTYNIKHYTDGVHLFVTLPEKFAFNNTRLEILDMSGRPVGSYTLNQHISYFDVSQLTSGLFVLNFYNDGRLVKADKFVRVRNI